MTLQLSTVISETENKHKQACTYECTHVFMHARTHTHTHTHTHMHAHRDARTHMHAHTHTRVRAPLAIYPSFSTDGILFLTSCSSKIVLYFSRDSFRRIRPTSASTHQKKKLFYSNTQHNVFTSTDKQKKKYDHCVMERGELKTVKIRSKKAWNLDGMTLSLSVSFSSSPGPALLVIILKGDMKEVAYICIQYCRVPKNGLPKNGQAGISSEKKNKNDPRLEKWVKSGFTTRKQRLPWRRLFQRHCWLRNDSTSTFWNISATFPARHASLRTVCALQANLRDSKSDWKIRTILAGVVKNKNDPGWDRLPPVLRHLTVL